MKILYIITQGELGGAQRYVNLLAKNFAQHHEVIIANSARGEQWLDSESKANGSIITHRFKHLVREINPLQDLLAFFEIKKYIQKIKPDVIHVNSTKAGVLVAFAKGKIPSVYTVHGWVFNEPMNRLKRQLYIFIEKISCRRHNKIIILGEHDRAMAASIQLGAPDKLTIIPHGIEPIKNQESRIKNQDNAIRIVTIANFYKTKGLTYLIDAVKKINNIQLTIYGDGPERPNLEMQINKDPTIILAGRVPNAVQQLSNFDIFILPSLKEGFPYAILEAMNAGLPIISTSVGEVPNILENEKTGLLVAPGDADQLAAAIKRLAENKTFATQLAAKARMRLNDFSFEQMLKKHEQVYQELTAGGNKCP